MYVYHSISKTKSPNDVKIILICTFIKYQSAFNIFFMLEGAKLKIKTNKNYFVS